MIILKQIPESNGAYANQTCDENFSIPVGYIHIPDEFEAQIQAVLPWVLLTIDNGVVTGIAENTAAKEAWKTPTLAELQTATLARIEGMCESAIVADMTVTGIVYPMTRGTAQDDLARAVARANAGDTAIPYGPHGQFATLYTPEQVQAIDKAFYSRCIINRTYYGLLQAWIGTESRTAKLTAIDYGSALPSAYTTLLNSQMSAVGIDASEFVAALTT